MSKVFFDIECYRNYFLICFKSESGATRYYEKFNDSPLDIDKITSIMNNYSTVGFNSLSYDLPMLVAGLDGWDNAALKSLSDHIIIDKPATYKVLKKHNLFIDKTWDTIDLKHPAPAVGASLKIYGARMHTKKLQDLPYDVHSVLSREQADNVRTYCFNDLQITQELYHQIKDRIELRESIAKQFNIDVDLRSKSDAQIAEAVFRAKLGIKSVKNELDTKKKYYYKAPDYIKFKSDQLKQLATNIANTYFTVMLTKKGKAQMRDNKVINTKLPIGHTVYKMGIGGLHSTEKHRTVKTDKNSFLIDVDVVGYYPSLISNNNIAPLHLGDAFSELYELFRVLRAKAKEWKQTKDSEGYKIMLNGAFGKLLSIFSVLFCPTSFIATTLTGQLSLLMLIEAVNDMGCEVVSANTDGITIFGNNAKRDQLNRVLIDWQNTTSLELEEVAYKSIHNMNVNTYIAFKNDGSVKIKGMIADNWIRKNPHTIICTEAVVNFIDQKKSLIDTIVGCRDLTKFTVMQKSEDGAYYNGELIGNTVRWYYGRSGAKLMSGAGKKLPRSDGAVPVQQMPDSFPKDINHNVYVNIAKKMLIDLGYNAPRQQYLC